jgi:hypothetical protein
MGSRADGVGMAVARRLGVAAVVVVLTLTLLAGNVVVAGHQTVLDPDYVTETVAEEDGYAAIHAELIGDGVLPVETLGPLNGSGAEVLGEIAPPGYLQAQTETNVRNLYAYLHGNERELRLVVDTRPVKNRTGAVVADRVANTSARELATFAGVEPQSVGGIDVDSELLLGIGEDRETFRQARGQVRDQVRERVANGEESPAADREVNQTLRELQPTVRERFADVDTGFGDEVDTAAGELVGVYVDGLLSPDATYDEFQGELTAAKTSLGEALGETVQSRLDRRLADQIVPTDYLPAEARQPFLQLRAAVVLLDVLGWLLPLLAIAVAAQLWVLADDPGTPVMWTGVAGVLAGGPSYLLGSTAEGALADQLRAALPEVGADLLGVIVALAAGVFGTLSAQSLLLVAVGGVCAVGGGLVRFDVVEYPRDGGGGPGGNAPTGGKISDDGPAAGGITDDPTDGSDFGDDPVDEDTLDDAETDSGSDPLGGDATGDTGADSGSDPLDDPLGDDSGDAGVDEHSGDVGDVNDSGGDETDDPSGGDTDDSGDADVDDSESSR